MNLEVRHLRLVREVSATGSLTKAGLSLHLTQSALSHQLNDIESRLGTRLFLRVGKRMVLTPAGERVLQSADDVLATIERTEDAVRQFSGSTRGVLRIATECCTCYHWLPALLGRYRRAHPHVDVRIELAATSDPLAHLLDGRLDVAIVSDKVRDRQIVTRALFDDELVVVVPPAHPLASRPYVRPEELAQETLLIHPKKEESSTYAMVLKASGVAPPVLEVQLTEATVEFIKAGFGVAVMARWAVDPYLKSGAVRAVPLTRRGRKRNWRAAMLKGLAQVPHVKAFVDLVASHPPVTARARGAVA
jgi:LysR family transcriptional regulator, regulator for metE and metH